MKNQDILKKTNWTVEELLNTELPKQRWAVPRLIPIGLTFLSGLPKSGKSWLALQIASAVGTGREIFGVTVRKRKVLYLALEDGPHRLQNRMRSQNIPSNAKIDFRTEWALLEESGLDDLVAEIKGEKYGFIVIDTLSRFSAKDQLKADEMSYYLGKLQKMALSLNLSILVIDHNSKGRQGSSILKLYGSIAKSGVADMIYSLDHAENDSHAILRGLGRDIGDVGSETIIHMEWNSETCLWEKRATPSAPAQPLTLKDKVKRAISKLVEEGRSATVTNIAKELQVKPPSVSIVLSTLYENREVRKLEKIGKEVPYVLNK